MKCDPSIDGIRALVPSKENEQGMVHMEKTFFIYNPPGIPETKLIEESSEGNVMGIYDLEYLSKKEITEGVGHLSDVGVDFGVRIDPLSDKLMTLMAGDVPGGLKLLVATPKEGIPDMMRSGVYDTAHSMGLEVYQEVCTLDEARSSINNGADGIIVRGSEGGGRVSVLGTEDLVSMCSKITGDKPLVARGDVSPSTIRKLRKVGATGFVLDVQVYTRRESPLKDNVKELLRDFKRSTTLLESVGKIYSVMEGTKASEELKEIEERLTNEGLSGKHLYKPMKTEIKNRVSGAFNSDVPSDQLLLVGRSARYCTDFEKFETIREMIESLSDVGTIKEERKKGTSEKGSGIPQRKSASPPPVRSISTDEVTVNGSPVPEDYYDNAIAIVGMGAVMPKGIGLDNYWNMILEGVDACGTIPKDRFDWRLHYDPDPSAPDKTYTKIGAFLTEFEMDPFEFKIPPKVFEQIDKYQRYAIRAAKEALLDSGLFENNNIDRSRVGVVVANSGGGENRDFASFRTGIAEIRNYCSRSDVWKDVPQHVRSKLFEDVYRMVNEDYIPINEDSMPGSLPNIASGRLANLFDFTGPNFITDAACASTLAAISSARDQLLLDKADIVVTGGADSMMATHVFVDFCKIRALTPDGSRPFSDGANGFLMGEGAGILIVKRLDDAVDAGDKIYAVVKGIGASSDGKGKGITAPNPKGQTRSIELAYKDAGVKMDTISFIEAHGTSTAVGDVAEFNSLLSLFQGLPKNSIGLTSVKSQIGHLKSAAGAAGAIKAALAIHNKVLPPQINFEKPNRYMEWEKSPFYVITEEKPWERKRDDIPRRCGVSAFGFGGTNFHMVLEEFDRKIYDRWKEIKSEESEVVIDTIRQDEPSSETLDNRNSRILTERKVDKEGISHYMDEKGHLEGEAFLFSSDNPLDLLNQATQKADKLEEHLNMGGRMRDLRGKPKRDKRYRLSIVADSPEDFKKQINTLKKVGMDDRALMALAAKGIFVGDRERIDHGRTCFMFPGQGSQYINMLRDLREKYTMVDQTWKEANRVMKDLIPEPLTSYVFKDLEHGTEEYKQASEKLRQTEFNQPSMLTADISIYKLLVRMGVDPDLVMGHSLGEYAALISSGIMNFDDALRAVSARGREMQDLPIDDPGKMASVSADWTQVDEVLKDIDDYVIAANKNCHLQTVIAGSTVGVEEAIKRFKGKGIDAFHIPVSHAFHSGVVAPVKGILRNYLSKLEINPPKIPILSNVTADYYPMEGDPSEIKEEILDLLKEQVASTVEWMGQVNRAYQDGCRTFVEVGPKRALSSFAYNILEEEVKKARVFPVLSNHPKKGGIRTFNEMVGMLWSLGYDLDIPENQDESFYRRDFIYALDPFVVELEKKVPVTSGATPGGSGSIGLSDRSDPSFSGFVEDNKDAITRFLREVHANLPQAKSKEARKDVDLAGVGMTPPTRKGVETVISGASFGLPGKFKKVFDENNLGYLLEGRSLIDNIGPKGIEKMIDKNIVRVDKKPDGSAEMIHLNDETKVAHLAGMMGEFDLGEEFGVPENLIKSLDITSQLAFAAGLLALKDAGIPLVKRYAQTSTGSILPEDWELPLEMQEDTGVIFASAFPGHDNAFHQLADYYTSKISKAVGEERRKIYHILKDRVEGESEKVLEDWWKEASKEPEEEYHIPRNFMFSVLAMAHSQFAQYIKAKGPNTQVNSACASTTLSISIAKDWIQEGRCKRVIVLGADDPTSEYNLEWLTSCLLSMGALTTEKDVEKAALPFDRRRKGMIIGSGAAGLILEAEEEPKRRGMNPLVEILGSHIGNSAFHGSRLDIAHIARSMNSFIRGMEEEHEIDRKQMASDMIFMSHETYTPARGGSSAAEVEALRRTFGEKFREILITNTKGYTGHAFGCCIEDPALVKILTEGKCIPLANYTPEQIDPQFEGLRLSRGGPHERHYGLRIAAGFGSQLAFLLVRKPDVTSRYSSKELYRNWLESIATTSPPELELDKNVLKLKDNGLDHLILHRAVKRESSQIGYEREEFVAENREEFHNVKDKVVRIFVDKTGIPRDQVDIDANLETEMGIDSVKQVELFGAARVFFDLPKDEGVDLGDYPTLRNVIYYIMQNQGKLRRKPRKEIDEKRETEESPEPEEMEKPAGSFERIKEKIITTVSEKTGYPEDMLDLDLDLEADLGIDTVKQVELFAQAREEFDLPRDEGINLSDLNTLRKIIEYISEMIGEGEIKEPAKEGEEISTVEEKRAESGDHIWNRIRDRIVAVVSEKTGYPEDMLELDLDLEADLGIDTVKQVELFAQARDEFDLPRDESVNLGNYNTLRKIIDYVVKQTEVGRDQLPSDKLEEVKERPSVKETDEEKEPTEGERSPYWNKVKERIVSVVSEKTGYPEDMLELDLDLEADLGIDTVKQVELFAKAREDFDLPQDDGVNLSDYNTLRKIVDYVVSITGEEEEESVGPEPVEEGVPMGEDNPNWGSIKEKILEVVAEKTGYPEDMLELDLDLEADLGIDTVKQVELFAQAREEFDLPRDESVNLSDYNTLRKIIDYVAGKSAGGEEQEKKVSVDQLKERINRWVLEADKTVDIMPPKTKPLKGKKAIVMGGGKEAVKAVEEMLGAEVIPMKPEDVSKGKVDTLGANGLINLYPLELKGKTTTSGWKKESDKGVKSLFHLGRALHGELKEGGFFVSVTTMGGKFGLDQAVNPVNGGVSGFTKAVRREYSKAKVITLDLPEDITTVDAVDRIARELSREEVQLEAGWDGKYRYLPSLRIIEPASPRVLEIKDGMNILVSGGASGITARIVKELSKIANLKLHMLGRTEVVDDVGSYVSMGEEELKRVKEDLKESLKKGGVRVTPVLLNKEFGKIEKSIGIHRLLDDIRENGSEGHYHAVDVKDIKKLKGIAKKHGPFHGVIHAAGVELSKLMINKKEEDFRLVYDTKVEGAKALIDSTKDHDLSFFLSFSSVAGRFGNGGQVDYSAANDFLNKIHGTVLKYHPTCHVKTLGWSAWKDVGMASRGSVKTILEVGGVKFIPVDVGVEKAITEITYGTEREVIYSGSLGPMDKEDFMKWEEGIHERPLVEKISLSPLLDEKVEEGEDFKVFTRKLDGVRERFLPDHSVMGKMVLPGVMGMEIFSEAASFLVPELDVVGLEDVSYKKAVNVDGEREIRVEARISEKKKRSARVSVSLLGEVNGSMVELFSGTVRFGYQRKKLERVEGHPIRPSFVRARVGRNEIYDHLFHGERFRVLDGMEILKDGEILGIYHPVPEDLVAPETGFTNGDLVFSPMQVEAGFQAAGSYVLDRFNMMALPIGVKKLTIYRMMRAEEGAVTWVCFKGRDENTFDFDVHVMDLDGNIRIVYEGYQLKGMMPYEDDIEASSQVEFDELDNVDHGIRAFRLDMESIKEEEAYRSLFSGSEWEDLIREKMTAKRRREHTAGRIIAKEAVAWKIATEEGRHIPLDEVIVETGDSGKPYCHVGSNLYRISISHSHRWAVASVSKNEHGIDIEISEPRPPSFQQESLTDDEMKNVKKWSKSLRITQDEIVTLIFSAKESFLKYTGSGLRENLRSVEIDKISRSPGRSHTGYRAKLTFGGERSEVLSRILGGYVLSVCPGPKVNRTKTGK